MSDDIIIKSVSAAILVVYVAFIIFLRDSVRIKNILESNDSEDYYESDTADTVPETYDTDLGETVKIVSKKPSSGIITSQNYKPSIHSGLKSNISAEELKEQFGKIVTEELPTDVNSDEQFLFVLEKILNVIKDAYLAHSVIFFLYNENNQELTVQKYFSNSLNS
ncbi:MAG: diguanylate cyclase, partial [Ignavibacteriae bacterium]|nr:diguanylate cyclase [Ignavibacteriota bacterium]